LVFLYEFGQISLYYLSLDIFNALKDKGIQKGFKRKLPIDGRRRTILHK